MKYIIVPGLNNSGPDHWQTKWELSDPRIFSRVEQQSWDEPEKTSWVEELEKSVAAAEGPLILVAHSLGCVTVAHWAANHNSDRVAGALLVAPADVEKSTKTVFSTFCPVPRTPLPFRSITVGSGNDQYASIERIRDLAQDWNTSFIDVGLKGHINAQSGLGFWEEGFDILTKLVNEVPGYRGEHLYSRTG
ncbi:MAG: alpha/beta hydrolase [Flavitalea sp.]